jgi:hypothetical protein
MKPYRILFLFLLGITALRSPAQQVDPTLTGAVAAQTSMLKQIFKDREETQQKIIAAETAVAVAMDRVHSVENTMLDYLSNVQGGMQNLYQIKRAHSSWAPDSQEHESAQQVSAWSSQGQRIACWSPTSSPMPLHRWPASIPS